ncbi:MAG: zf-HC2 domain-containing protein [Archangiaceae bacterium]|nr:zf-HC2 domain-containing protein [Archangiaceae bacterium]
MKPACPTRLQLESAVLSELSPSRTLDVEAHAETCARCRHELNWLRTETALFAQRAAREEVTRLWEGVEARGAPKRSAAGLTRAGLALAASVLLAVAVGGSFKGGPRGTQANGEPLPMSVETMSVDWQSDTRASMPCYTPGFGIACGEVEFASR